MEDRKTLQLTYIPWRTLIFSLVLIVIIFGIAEGITRIPAIQEKLPPPSVGSYHRVFEIRLDLLNEFVEENGDVDCIFMGSSMVAAGINPDVFNQEYSSLVGEDIACFNFGIEGLTASSAAVIADFLVREYQPALLIYGTSARDYSEKIGGDSATALNVPWLRYQSGEFSVEGWLVEHSFAFKYMLVYRNWMTAEIEKFKEDTAASTERFSANGSISWDKEFENISTPPTPDKEKAFFGTMSEYEISQTDLDGLESILGLRNSETQVVVVEMPVHWTFMYFFDNNEEDYLIFFETIPTLVADNDGIFLPSTSLELIPDHGWANRNHLNTTGSTIFSTWLGEQIANAVLSGGMAPIK